MDARNPKIDLMTELRALQNAQLGIDPLLSCIETGDRIGAVEMLMQLIDIAQTGRVLDPQERGFALLPWAALSREQRAAMWIAGTAEFTSFAAAN